MGGRKGGLKGHRESLMLYVYSTRTHRSDGDLAGEKELREEEAGKTSQGGEGDDVCQRRCNARVDMARAGEARFGLGWAGLGWLG